MILPLGGGEIVDLPPIPEHVRRDILRDPEPARSSVTAVLDYQMTGVFNVSVPIAAAKTILSRVHVLAVPGERCAHYRDLLCSNPVFRPRLITR